MRPTLLAALCAATLAALPAHAVFKCTVGGKTTYSDAPCGDGGREIDIAPAGGRTPDTAAAGARAKEANSRLTEMSLDRKILESEREIERIQGRMEKDLAELRSKKGYARNNLAGATWEQSISSEMQAVAARYQAEMQTEQARLDDLRKRRASVSGD